jgi:drug/metabolite transporter (DMT)-like permease
MHLALSSHLNRLSDDGWHLQATSPIFAVFMSRIFLGERFTGPILMSLLPIIAGVTICTLTEINFDVVGFTSAIVSTLSFVCQSIYSKVSE